MKLSQHPLFQYSIIFFIVFAIGTFFRLYPLLHFTPGDSHEKATIIVLSQLKTKATQQIEKLFPNVSGSQKEALVIGLTNKSLHNGKKNIKDAIATVSKNLFADSRSDHDYPFLLASDSFYYYDLTQRLNTDGKMADTLIGSKYLNDRMLAPLGHLEPINWHPYVGISIYKFLQFFKPKIPLMYAVSFTSIFIFGLTLLAFLWNCKILNITKPCALVASLFFSLTPIYVKRSMFGWYDNDPYSVLFPLLILGLTFQCLHHLDNKRTTIIYGLLTAIALVIYAHFWHGWIFLFTVLIVATLFILGLNSFFHKTQNSYQPLLSFFLTFILGTFVLISISFGPNEFFILFKEGWIALSNFLKPQLSAWPDLYMSVGELKSSSLSYIADMTGGLLFCLIATFGIIKAIIKALNQKLPLQSSPVLILTIYLLATIFITLGAQRFVMFCIVPLSLCFGLGLSILLKDLDRFLNNKKWPNYLQTATIALTILILIFIPAKRLQAKIPTLLNPIYNETWDRALIKIREQTPENSIINAWWSPGHFIKSTAQRQVTFDGASINYPQSYWLSSFFLQSDEDAALGILRMLNNSGHKAAEHLQSIGVPLPKSVQILHELVKLNKVKANIVLNIFIKNNEKTNRILSLTHKKPPPSYILLYNEFVDNNLQLKFIGNWNFERIAQINSNPELLKNVPKQNSQAYIDFLWELAGGPHKYSGILNQLGEKNGLLLFDHKLSIDKETFTCRIDSTKYGTGTPISIFYLKEGKVTEKFLENADKPYSVILYKSGKLNKAILMDRFLAKSMLVQMYFFDAKGLKNIKPIIHEYDLTRRTEIKVFEVNWESYLKQLQYPIRKNINR